MTSGRAAIRPRQRYSCRLLTGPGPTTPPDATVLADCSLNLVPDLPRSASPRHFNLARVRSRADPNVETRLAPTCAIALLCSLQQTNKTMMPAVDVVLFDFRQ